MAANRETTAIQWRPEVNALTSPQSHRLLFVPHSTVSDAKLAAEIAEANPNFNEEAVRTILNSRKEIIQRHLINGEAVVEENAFTTTISLAGRLNNPDDPPPPPEECVHVRVYPAPAFVAAVRQAARLERLPMEKKLPLIAAAQDTVLELRDVLNPAGALQLTGSDLRFDRSRADEGCVIEGAAGGSVAQTRFIKTEASTIIVMPDLPAQPHPWNNEYTVSVSTRYSPNGTLRTGVYERTLRAPLTVSGMWEATPPLTGILTGNEASAHVNVTGGSVAAAETLRIQAVCNAQGDALLLSLLDMKEGGAAGAAVSVTENGAATLPGFSGSAVTSLNLWVNNYAALKEMVRSVYGGRLVDVLKVETA
jgi:hypothetical protein